MVEVMPFGKYKGNSIEQIAFRDYKYFSYFLVDEMLKNKRIRKFSLEKRIEWVEYKLNNFKPIQPCGKPGCQNIPKFISIYTNFCNGDKISSPHFVYCSQECFESDPRATIQTEKINLSSLKFRSAVFRTKADTNWIINVIAWCMGIRNQRLTKEYLNDFVDGLQVWG